MTEQINILEALRSSEVRDIFRRNHVQHVYLTGSFSRNEQTAASDIDLIYQKQENSSITLFNI